ncbi:uncharacterized protein LOC109540838 [Dendroctonus ponderosae]|nr:uncharacterized protein LOC109540838 [Dendroctonus ponderosae]KAH1026994.1 hypothetical protein HUJ05_000573 [Dendroctonus ponderosae]KAH1026995.1 hypothetical protein HUJ05_000573 [Dendroctonus ponderosae]
MDNQVEPELVREQMNDDVKSSTAAEPNGDEDVPEGFFDDFLKEDFMAGLDIIDEDNDESDALLESQKQETLPVDNARGSSKGKLDSVEVESPKAVDQSKQEAAVSTLKKSGNKRGVDADFFDIRRDPEKTRQAIAKDKMKGVKDKEKRLITDIVQTGLVPPGMELEVDINEVCQLDKGENAAIQGKPKPDISKEKDEGHSKKRKRSSKESDKQKRAKLDKSRASNRSPEAKGRTVNRVDLTTNHYKNSSPLLEEWVRKLSPLRRNSRRSSHHRKRSSSPRSPMHRRRSKSRSLSDRRSFRRSRSRDWSPKYRRHRRDKSYSPESSASRPRRSRPRKEEKMSFLEELAAKLNEKHPPTGYAPVPNYQAHNMVPLVQPYPQFFNPAAPMPAVIQPPQYDESFFIGNSHMQPAVVNQFEENFPPKLPVSDIHGRSFHSNQLTTHSEDNLFSAKDIPKLFADRRIKLSDFLALTAKPSVSNTTASKLQEKIKVIQRCQNAIKILNEQKFSGPLVVYKTASQENLQEVTVSPLLKKPVGQLPFTTPGMEVFPKDFKECCVMLLTKVGVTSGPSGGEQVPLREPSRTRSMASKLPPSWFCNPPSPAINSMSTQTDREFSSCRECLRRRSTPLTNSAVQTENPVLTFSVSTQVSESDFYAMIPKTQSLASLTPAQLLGKQLVVDQARSSRLSRLPSPPPAPFIRSQNNPYGSSLFNQAKLSQITQSKSASEQNLFNGDRGRSRFHKRF